MRHICTNNICTSLTEKQLKIEMLILEKKEIAHIPKANNVAIKLQKSSLGAQKKLFLSSKQKYTEKKAAKKTQKPKKKKKQQRPILMEVTRRPQALRSRPILLAVTPFPRPLTTPPVTNTYFIFILFFSLFFSTSVLDNTYICKQNIISENRTEQAFPMIINNKYWR